MRRGEGGGWIFVGKYERYEWAKEVSPATPSTPKLRTATPTTSSRGGGGEVTWQLVRSTYSRSKSIQALSTSGGRKTRKASILSESRTVRASMDDTSPERKLSARITIFRNSPPSVVIVPRNPRATSGVVRTAEAEEIEEGNKEDVLDALIQGLWIVWREGIVDHMHLSSERNTWAPVNGEENRPKKGLLDVLLCRS
jgi:hypothetical protein